MTNAPLMPMATAVWLVENTTLTFKQIADFCNLHEVEIQGIADGEVAKGIKAYNPIMSGQLSREEIELSANDQNRPLKIQNLDIEISNSEKKIKKYISSLTRKKTLTLWFGISGQKRIWVEQKDFLPAFVEQLSPWYSSFAFIIDGFTEYEDSNQAPLRGSKATPVSQDLEVINSIREKLACYSNVSVESVVGQTYREKIQKCQSADFFIANAGAGQLVPHRFCRKSGILHSNEKHCVFPTGINNTSVQLVDKSLVKDVGNLFAKSEQNRQAGSGLISYSINIQNVIDLAIQMLKLN